MNNALNPGCPFLNILSQSLTVHFFLSAPLPPSLSCPVSFTCSLSCYILPLLWGWQSHIHHVIGREMWESCRGETGGSDGMMLLAIYASALACHDTCKHHALCPRFIFFMLACQYIHPNTRCMAVLRVVSLKTACTIAWIPSSVHTAGPLDMCELWMLWIHSKIITVNSH